jgi:glutathione S-transferase
VTVDISSARRRSMVVLEYIEDKFFDRGGPLLPRDAGERAHVRLWARFADERICPCLYRLLMAPAEGVSSSCRSSFY